MKAFVTGAAGFIGSTLTERLLENGADVIGLDCFTDYYPRAAKERNLAAAMGHPRFRFVEAQLQTVPTSARFWPIARMSSTWQPRRVSARAGDATSTSIQ